MPTLSEFGEHPKKIKNSSLKIRKTPSQACIAVLLMQEGVETNS